MEQHRLRKSFQHLICYMRTFDHIPHRLNPVLCPNPCLDCAPCLLHRLCVDGIVTYPICHLRHKHLHISFHASYGVCLPQTNPIAVAVHLIDKLHILSRHIGPVQRFAKRHDLCCLLHIPRKIKDKFVLTHLICNLKTRRQLFLPPCFYIRSARLYFLMRASVI